MDSRSELSSPHGTEYVKPVEQSSNLINLVEKIVLHSPSIWPYSPSNEINKNQNIGFDDKDDDNDDDDYDYDYFDNDDEFESDDLDDCSSTFSSLIHDSLTDNSSLNDNENNEDDNEDDFEISSIEKKAAEDKKLIKLTNEICNNLNKIHRLPSSLKFERAISPFTHDLLSVRKRRQQIRKFGKVISEKSSPNNEFIDSRAKLFLALLKKQLNSNVEQSKAQSNTSNTSNLNSLKKPKSFNDKTFYNENDKLNKFYNEFEKTEAANEKEESVIENENKNGICISKLRPHLLSSALQEYFKNLQC